MRKKLLLPQADTKKQFKTIMCLNIGVLILVICITCLLYIQLILKRNSVYVNRVAQQYQVEITGQVSAFEQLVQTAASDNSLRQYLSAKDPYQRYQASLAVSTLFSNLKMIQPNIVDVFLFTPEDPLPSYAGIAQSQKDILSKIWSASSAKVIGAYPYLGPSYQNTDALSILVIGSCIFDPALSLKQSGPIGAVAIAVDLASLGSSLSELTNISGITPALIDQNGQQLLIKEGFSLPKSFSPIKESETNGTTVSTGFLQDILITPIPKMNATLFIQTNKAIILKELFLISGAALLLTGFLFAFLQVLYYNMRVQISSPLATLTHAIEEITLHPSDPTVKRSVPVVGNTDIRLLSRVINRMLVNESHLTKQLLDASTHLYELELSRNRLELQFLRSQINPHFLYNTLETIRSIAIVEKVPQVALAAKNLGKMLRYSIKGQENLPLAEEIDIIKCYLDIQHLRFGDRFLVCFKLEDGTLALKVPRMCLQPLVENAIVHGLESSLTEGLLTITSHMEEDYLIVTVEDNGKGIDPDTLEEINRNITHPATALKNTRQGSIGLINVARHLQIALGQNFKMTVESQLNQGTCISLQLPIDKLC